MVFDVANTFQDATSFLARATFLYISRAGFADLGDPGKPRLTRVGKFSCVCFHAVFNAASAGLNFSTFCLDQAPIDRSFAIATGAERSTTAQITTILFIIGHSPKKPMRLPSLALACVRCARSTGSVWWTIKTAHSIDICQRVLDLGQAVQPEERHHELRRNRASDAARREREEEVAIASAHPGLHGSAKMENPTKASTATLRTIIAIAATSMTESRLRSNAMMRYWAAVERPL